MSIYKKRKHCAICSGEELLVVLNYGKVPLAGYFPSKDELNVEELFGLNVVFCPQCSLVQTDSIIDADKLFRDYRYMSSIGLSGHFTSVAKMYKERFNLGSDSTVVEIGSNDGVLLKPLKDLGIDALGFEPSINISEVARQKGVRVISDYFNEEKAKQHLAESSVDLISCNNCFAHIDDIQSIVRGVKFALKEDGVLVFEVSYLKDLIDKLQYDNIYHEHIYYYSLVAIKNLFDKFGMTVVDYDFIPIHSGSIRVFVQNGEREIPGKVRDLLSSELNTGMSKFEWFKDFGSKVDDHRKMVKDKISKLVEGGSTVVGYGASGRANMLCNIAGITSDEVKFIVDESPERAGRYIAGSKIPVVSPESLNEVDADYVVVFAWNFFNMIKKKLDGRGYKFITFFPEYKVEE